MPVLADNDRQYLTQLFREQLKEPVRILYFTQHESPLFVPGQECQFCRETGEILSEVSSLSDKLSVEVHDFWQEKELAAQHGVDKIPAMVFQGRAQGQIRYYGVPSGYEFATLIEDILDLSRGQNRLSEKTREALAAIKEPVHIQVLVTPT